MQRAERFLILGNEGGTYYAGERKLTLENAKGMKSIASPELVDLIVKVSEDGRAPKNDPAIFALALCMASKDATTRRAAYLALPRVCRIPTHLFQLCQAVKDIRGWSKGLAHAVARFYNGETPKKLAYHIVKYQQRDGWSHRDVLRLAHVHPRTGDHAALFNHVCGRGYEGLKDPETRMFMDAVAMLGKANAKEAATLIRKHRLPREAVPTEFLNEVQVWDALLESMPITATIRSLGKMTENGLLKGLSDAVETVAKRVPDPETIATGRVHPIQFLSALRTYSQGHGERGKLTWKPVARVKDALEEGFYLAFKAIPSTGKRMFLAIDISGSMDCDTIAGVPGLTPREAAAAMAMVTARTEPRYMMMGFASRPVQLEITAKMRLEDVQKYMAAIPMGGTDCALPFICAHNDKIAVDGFVVYTDCETWYGNIHPTQALAKYRR
jgi:60 kDa SS-A/Ro ribonucleoprotein